MASKSPNKSLYNLDKDQINELYEKGAFLIIEDMPTGTEFGIDYGSWSVGPKFRGLKMIPPGLHFLFYSAVNKEGTAAPRTGFFHHFREKEVLVKRYDQKQETILDMDVSYNVKDMDSTLAPYPYQHYQKWCSLTSHITLTTVERVQPQCTLIHSATPLLHNPNADADVANASSVEDKLDANFVQDDSQVMRFSRLEKKKQISGLTARELSNFYMDTASILTKLFTDAGSSEEILGEVQISFVVFLLGHVYSAFEQWKILVDTICRARQTLHDNPTFYKLFIRVLHFHLKETPSDFFVDIVSRNNFLTSTLKLFFESLREEEGLDGELVIRGQKFQTHLENYFSWDFGQDEEDAPVIVEL